MRIARLAIAAFVVLAGVPVLAGAADRGSPPTCGGSCGIPDRSVWLPQLSLTPTQRAVVDVDLATSARGEDRVVVRLEKRRGKRWVTVRRATRRSKLGTVHVRFAKRLRRGTYRARIDGIEAPSSISRGPTRTVTVR